MILVCVCVCVYGTVHIKGLFYHPTFNYSYTNALTKLFTVKYDSFNLTGVCWTA